MPYDHRAIDAKWQARYEAEQPFQALNDPRLRKFYPLVEFPFPSGAGLHVGHPRSYTALDVLARKKRMEGFNVLYPMGWDAFGLPTENYALKTGIPPAEVTRQNTDTFRRQLKAIGFSFDWSREVNTTDPTYYKWTQWMFLEFFKAGLAYKAKTEINWCPKDKIGLANEEVVGGACERCGTPVEKREKEQWMIAITKYADRLLEDLAHVDYLPKIKKQQEDWIGRSEGAEIDFAVEGGEEKITVFTTRPDTLFGVTYVVLAPEHPLVAQLTTDGQRAEVAAYVAAARAKSEEERGDDQREKTGVFTGAYALNPVNGERVPVWAADYVLAGYGTGAVMAVPAHDERDFAFAKKYQIEIRQVIDPLRHRLRATGALLRTKEGRYIFQERDDHAPFLAGKFSTFGGGVDASDEDGMACILRELAEETELLYSKEQLRFIGAIPSSSDPSKYNLAYAIESVEPTSIVVHEGKGFVILTDEEVVTHPQSTPFMQNVLAVEQGRKSGAFVEDGILVCSSAFTGQSSEEARKNIVAWLEERKVGRKKVTYKLRDWVFSRQRYWGEPIPLVHCEKDGWVALPEEQLPLTLPEVGKYEPTDTGESPLAAITDWVHTSCPTCGGPAVRETDTMPNWAGSSWYFLRYIDPQNDQQFASREALEYWIPVDLYNGGMEHTTLHLLYSRFWYKFLFDRGHIPAVCGNEPYSRRHSHGLIMAEDGAKMSKSKGNVVNPDEVVVELGADVLRTYMLFIGPFEEPAPWQKNGLIGVRRFLEKVERLAERVGGEESLAVTKAVHKAIAKVTADIEGFRFNTAVAALMTAVNDIGAEAISSSTYLDLLTILSPFAPHITNELAEKVGYAGLLDRRVWPTANSAYLVDDEVTIAVQFGGKTRGAVTVPTGATQEDVLAAARADAVIAKYFVGEPKKIIFVPGRILNIIL